jgi:hypothetical protein
VVGSLFRLDGVRCAGRDDAHYGVRGCTVSFVALVSSGRPCRLTPGVPCQYDLTWGKGALCGVVGVGVRRGPATPAVGPAHGLTSARRLSLFRGGELLVRTGCRSRGGNLSCEWVVAAEVRYGQVVVRTAKYSKTERSCRVNRQVLRGGGILLYGPSGTRTVSRMPLLDDCRVVGRSLGPRQVSKICTES